MGRIPHDNDILYEFDGRYIIRCSDRRKLYEYDGKYIKKYSGRSSTYIIN